MYRYRITLESLSPGAEPVTLQFEIENHDNIAAIAERLPSRFGLDENSTRAMIVGAKLLGEVALKNRDKPPFNDLRPALRQFTQRLKQQPATDPSSANANPGTES